MQKLQFAIALPNDNGSHRHVTARAYLAALRTAQAHPDEYFRESFCSRRDYITGAGIVRQHWDMVRAKHAAQWQRVNVWGSAAPLQIDYPIVRRIDNILDKYQTIRGSGIELELVSHQDSSPDLPPFKILDVFTEDNRLFKVEEFTDYAATWSGYLLTDLSETPFDSQPYIVNLLATDGLKDLDGAKFSDANGKAYWGYQPVLVVIIRCLNALALDLPIAVSCEIFGKYADAYGVENNDGMNETLSPLEQCLLS